MSEQDGAAGRVRYDLPLSQDQPMWDIRLSMHHLPAMAVVDELGVFQALEGGPETADEAARRLGLNRRATDILFSMLRALGLIVPRRGLDDLARAHGQLKASDRERPSDSRPRNARAA